MDRRDDLELRAATPEWEKVGRVHDWRNYISDRVKELWPSFSREQQIALIEQAEQFADREEWD